MRTTIRLFLFLLCSSLSAQQTGIQGTAVNAVTQQPLSGVHVRLVSLAAGSVSGAWGALTNQAGAFSIAGMPAGRYVLIPEARGFVYVQKGVAVPVVTLKSGEWVADFKLQMTPHAVIRGRVLDENGEPMPDLRVQPEPASPDTVREVMKLENFKTNDRGEFRISGAPGKFFIRAAPGSKGGDQIPEIRLDSGTPVVHAPTYYPSTATTGQAAVVEVAAGGEVSGIDIRMLRQRSAFSISGVVSGIPREASGAMVMLTPDEYTGVATGSRGAAAGPDGKFTFVKLQSGRYRVFARSSIAGAHLYSQEVDLKLDNADISNLDLVLRPAEEITGKIAMAGEPDGSKAPEGMLVRLERAGGSVTTAIAAQTGRDGSFRLTGIAPGRYRLDVDRLPDNSYLQAVQLDSANVVNGELNLSQGVRGARLKITVSRNGAEISGNILDRSGARAIGPVSAVWLFESAKEVPAVREFEHSTRVAADGRYRLYGIPPGKYRLFALDLLGFTDFGASRPEILKKGMQAAGEIEIKEGDRVNQDLIMWRREDIDEKQ